METADEKTSYILGTEERRRLELLEQYLDPITVRSLDAIGVEPGWRCLEVGAGGGSVARMLCDRVGPSGRPGCCATGSGRRDGWWPSISTPPAG